MWNEQKKKKTFDFVYGGENFKENESNLRKIIDIVLFSITIDFCFVWRVVVRKPASFSWTKCVCVRVCVDAVEEDGVSVRQMNSN